MAVSIKDIAREANVSYSTVSRALSDNPRLKLETRQRIQRLAAEMGYSPSAVARSLVTNRTQTIGIVATTMIDLFQAEVVWAVEQRALQHDYGVILTQSGRESERECSEIEALRERRVDGIILISVRACGPYASLLQGTDIPIVFVNDPGPVDYGYSVRVDNLEGVTDGLAASARPRAPAHRLHRRATGYLGKYRTPRRLHADALRERHHAQPGPDRQ